MKRILYVLTLLALVAGAAGTAAKARFDVAPPGQIVQDTVAYLSGENTNSAWHVVTSREQHQWYLSFYAPAGNGVKLVYRLPNGTHELLSRVTKAVNIVGAAEFRHRGVQDVVVWDRQAGADCGTADVTVFGADAGGRVSQRVHVENSCALHANIVKRGALYAVELTGPYYGRNAPLCCPTKRAARALLSYTGGTWSVTPNYFIISASLAAHR